MNFLKALGAFFAGGNPIAETIKAIDGVTTSAEERLALKSQFIGGIVEAQSKVLVAEAQSKSWLTASWRPLVMLSFASILIYSFFVGPMFKLPTVPVPDDLWTLMKIGIGGYVGGRSVEKLAEILPRSLKRGKKNG
jgi:hypothetical protein